MNIVPFKAEHLYQIEVQNAQADLKTILPPGAARVLEGTEAFTALDDDGRVLGCAGVQALWPGRDLAWAYISRHAGPHMAGITRAVRRFLDLRGARRTEMAVDCGFAAGHRWAKLLGFRLEIERMEGYLPDGGAAAQYVRVRV
jgi:hypothetical protein